MYVKDWMTTDPIIVSPDTPIMEAQKLMRENRIRRLPVVDRNKLVGIVTYRDLMEASPSDATTLSIHELNYLLSKLTVKDVMAKSPITIDPNDTAEHAALLGAEKGVGAFPVVQKGKVVGIATESDIFRFYLALLGAKEDLSRITLEDVDVQKGMLQEIGKIIEESGGTLVSIVSVPQRASDLRMVMIRARAKSDKPLIKTLKDHGYKIHK